jgi:hypothetical protein
MNNLYVYCIGGVSLAGIAAVVADEGPSAPPSIESRRARPVQVVRRLPGPDGATTVLRFDHSAGTASRLVVDEASGRILREQILPGRPQSSRCEFEDAVAIIGRDETLAELVARGAEPEGGFIVDGPAGAPLRHRYIQIRLLSPDRRTLLRVVVVDLTAGVVASARTWFE